MAAEIHVRAALSFAKSGRSGAADTGELSVTMAGTKHLDTEQSLTTAEEALLLGEVVAAGAWYQIENLDTANSVDLKPATGGTVTTRIPPSGVALGTFGPSITAPFVVSVTGPADIHILLIQA